MCESVSVRALSYLTVLKSFLFSTRRNHGGRRVRNCGRELPPDLDSLTKHFITDEYWCWINGMSLPDYAVSYFWDKLVPYIRSGALKVY